MAAGRHGGYRDNEFRDREADIGISRKIIRFPEGGCIRIRNGGDIEHEKDRGWSRDDLHSNVRIIPKEMRERTVTKGHDGHQSTFGPSGAGPRSCNAVVSNMDREPGEVFSDVSEEGLHFEVQDNKGIELRKSENGNHMSHMHYKKRKFSPIFWDRDDRDTNRTVKSKTISEANNLPCQPPLINIDGQSPTFNPSCCEPPVPTDFREVDISEESPIGLSNKLLDSPSERFSLTVWSNYQETGEINIDNLSTTRTIISFRWVNDVDSPADESELSDKEYIPKCKRRFVSESAEAKGPRKSSSPELWKMKREGSDGTVGRSSVSEEMNRRRVGAGNWVTVAETPHHLKKTVDILGIVVEAGVPHKSRGPDYCVILKIIDDSGTDRELSVNFFNRTIDGLPHLRGHLDIILLRDVRIGIHNQSPCASFFKTSYFALFDSRDGHDCKPYQLSPGLRGLQSAENFVRELRLWSSTTRFDAGVSNYALRLANINTMDFFDLVCKVLRVSEVSDGNWMLFVWDGTDAPPISLSTELADEEWNSLPLHIEPVSLPQHVLHGFPHVGTILRVLVDEKFESFGFHFQHGDKWVRLRNLMCKTESGLWKGIFTLETKFRLLSEQDNSVKDRLRVGYDRLSEQGRIPSALIPGRDLLTVVGNEDADFTTLLDLLCSPLACGGFKCIVRVVAAYPSRAKDFLTPEGLYRLRLTLEDPTARIHAYLSHEDAVFLFGGDLEDYAVSNKMNKLLGVDECGEKSSKNPPWVQCCIGFNSLGPSKQFHICKTAFAA